MAAAGEVGQLLLHGRFACPEAVDLALHEDAATRSELHQPWFNPCLEHGEHLGRHTGHGDYFSITDMHPDAGGGSAGIGYRFRAVWKQRLHPVAFRHDAPAFREHLLDLVKRWLMKDQLD